MRKKPKTPTEVQKRLLGFIQRYEEEQGYPPSFREMMDRAGISSTSMVSQNLNHLERLGYIERDTFTSRGLRVVKTLIDQPQKTTASAQRLAQGLLRIPLSGCIVASEPVPLPASNFSYYDPETAIEIATSMLPVRNLDLTTIFALEVQGDSMIEDMVNDGDIVIMQIANEASNGEMVAVWLADNEEMTLKKFYREKNRIRLQPANPMMKPIYIDDSQSIEIQGKVMLIITPMKSSIS